MVNHGLSGSTNRDNPKSVSFTNGPEDHEPVAFRSLVNRISEGYVSRRPSNRVDVKLTLKFDIAMYQGDAVRPPDSPTQFTPYLS